MDRNDFWNLVDQSQPAEAGDQDEQLARLRSQLARLPADQVIEFKKQLDACLDDAYRWDLWGAAYLLMGGCSDDSFEYFRAWLISQGREIYARVLADPDALADVASDDPEACEFEAFEYAPYEAYEQLTGAEMPVVKRHRPAEPPGRRWDFDDLEEMRKRYPKIWQRAEPMYE